MLNVCSKGELNNVVVNPEWNRRKSPFQRLYYVIQTYFVKKANVCDFLKCVYYTNHILVFLSFSKSVRKSASESTSESESDIFGSMQRRSG